MLGVHLRVFPSEVLVDEPVESIPRGHSHLEPLPDCVVGCQTKVLKKESRFNREILIKEEHDTSD